MKNEHLTPEQQELMSAASSAATFLAPHADDKVKIIRWESEGGGSGYAVDLADGRRVFQSSDWGGWHVERFHLGRWCHHIIGIAADRRRQQEEQAAAERAAEEAAERAKWAPVDDSALFPKQWLCCVCHRVPVDAENGIDTCDTCLANQ